MRFLQVETDLRQAIDRGEFVVPCQPILRLEPFALVGFEGLVRWKHPTDGFVPPMEFIPVAEETGSIVQLGETVLRNACARVAEWRRDWAQDLFVSVNLSPRQFAHPDLVPLIERVLTAEGLPASALRLEITEGLFITDIKRATSVLNKLKDMGVRLYLDDFGTGFWSMSYLHKLPFDVLKIDRSFVMDMLTNDRSRALVQGIITMARALGVSVVAEGIEGHDQFEALRELGCDYGQGFYFGKPLPAGQATVLIRSTSPTDIRELAGTPLVREEASISYDSPLSRRASTTLELLREFKQIREEFDGKLPG